MKVLLISRQDRVPRVDPLFKGLEGFCDLTLIEFSSSEIKGFTKHFQSLDISSYERIIVDIPIRRLCKHYKCLIGVKNLVFFEEDLCQEFIPCSKFYKKFSIFCKKIATCRVICTGYYVGRRAAAKGMDIRVVLKAYDESKLYKLSLERDIEIGFIGRINNKIYKLRRNLLTTLEKENYLTLIRTETSQEYLETLNRIKFFFSADLGFAEYMFKNFEAMACGCILVAYRQGHGEEEKLGLIDMENVILYSDAAEAKRKIAQVQQNLNLQKHIATAGQKLVEERHQLGMRAKPFYEALKEPISTYQPSWKDRLNFFKI